LELDGVLYFRVIDPFKVSIERPKQRIGRVTFIDMHCALDS
jgi:hypothetical protein